LRPGDNTARGRATSGVDRRTICRDVGTLARRQGRSARPGHVQIAFAADLFAALVAWLMLNHGSLSVLVHPNTTSPRRDHLVNPIWIGAPLDVHGEKLPDEGELEHAPSPNTHPVLRP